MNIDNIKIEPLFDSVERLEMNDPEYFAMPAISNSQLGLLQESPQKFLEGFKNEAKYVASFDLGSSIHQLLLEKDKYFLSNFDKPGGKVGLIMQDVHKWMKEGDASSVDDLIQKACKIWDYYSDSLTPKRLETLKEKGIPYLEFLNESNKEGMIVLTDDMREKCSKCVGSIKSNKYANDLIYPNKFGVLSFSEDVMIMDTKATFENGEELILKLKGKIDNWSIDLETNTITLNDLKSTGKEINKFPGKWEKNIYSNNDKDMYFVEGSFQKYKYYRQMFMYGHLLRAYVSKMYGKRNWIIKVNIIAVETINPFRSMVFRVGPRWIDYGKKEYGDLIRKAAYYKKYGYDKIPEYDGLSLFLIS